MIPPLGLSLLVASLSTALALLIGIPLGRRLAQHHHRRAARWLHSLLLTPLVLPPTVLGYVLLLSVGRTSVLGRWYEAASGSTLVFSRTGLVVAAMCTGLPIIVAGARDAFLAVDPHLVVVARSLAATRARIFWQVELPIALPWLRSAAVLAFSKALGDFGVTLMIAGNIEGQTRTASLALFDALQLGDWGGARDLALCLLAFSVAAAWMAGSSRSRPRSAPHEWMA